jgi:hypothetical protein
MSPQCFTLLVHPVRLSNPTKRGPPLLSHPASLTIRLIGARFRATMRLRFSILKLLTIVAFGAVCFAAIRPNATYWHAGLLNAFVIGFTVLLIGALVARGQLQAICIGALLLGGVYHCSISCTSLMPISIASFC